MQLLEKLILSGDIKNYKIDSIDEEGEVVSHPRGNRNTERLTIRFPSGNLLVVDTFCSGVSENTSMTFDVAAKED